LKVILAIVETINFEVTSENITPITKKKIDALFQKKTSF